MDAYPQLEGFPFEQIAVTCGLLYRPVPDDYFYEREFLNHIIASKHLFFPDGYLIQPTFTVSSPAGSAIPDLVYVRKDYSYWLIIEVETANHNLRAHVVPQVEIFRDADYNLDHVSQNLTEKCLELDRSRLLWLLRGEQPEVVVISNERKEDWSYEMKRAGVRFVVCKPFRHVDRGELIFLAEPIANELDCSVESLCTYIEPDPLLKGWLRVKSPAKLPVIHGQKISLLVNGCFYDWIRHDTRSLVSLRPLSAPFVLRPGKYSICERNGQFSLKEH